MHHFCAGIGDGNPVSTDPAYGAAAWHGTGLAPGCFLYTTDSTIVAPKLRGIQWTDSRTEWEWYYPVRHGDRLTMTVKLLDAVEKQGSTARAKAEGGLKYEPRAATPRGRLTRSPRPSPPKNPGGHSTAVARGGGR